MNMILESAIVGEGNPWYAKTQGDLPAVGGNRAQNAMNSRSRGDATRPARGIRTILVATDFSTCSTRAVEYAMALARQWAASLILLHVIDINPPAASTYAGSAVALMQELRVEAFTQMARLAGALAQDGVEAQSMIVGDCRWRKSWSRAAAVTW